jgi:hypothetical protein
MQATGTWWGFAEANATVMTVVVVLVVVAALGFVAHRVWKWKG